MSNEEKMIPLRSLVPEITGDNFGDPNFEANYKKLKRNLKAARENMGGVEGEGTAIPESRKVLFVRSMKRYFDDPEYAKLFDIASSPSKELTLEQQKKWMKYQVDMLSEDTSEEKRNEKDELFNLVTDKESFEIVDRVRERVLEDLKKICDVEILHNRLVLLNEYEKRIMELSKQVVVQVNEILKREKILKEELEVVRNENSTKGSGTIDFANDEIKEIIDVLKNGIY